MKTIFALFLLVFAHFSNAQTDTPVYLVAVKGMDGLLLSDGKRTWNLEVGEVFPFVRFVSASELKGGFRNPADTKYVLVQIDDQTFVAPTACFTKVEASQLASAAMAYRKIVLANREQSAPTVQLSKTRRSSMLKALRSAGLISTLKDGDSISDEQLIALYEKVEADLRLRNIESLLKE